MIHPRTTVACIMINTLVLTAAPAAAQPSKPPSAIDIEAGTTGFADDGIVWEGVVGVGARLYLLPRVSVGPELTYIKGGHHSHLTFTGNIVFDLLGPTNGRPRPATPYIVAGAGLFQTRQQFFTGPYTSGEGAFTVGGGVRAMVHERVSVGVDARLGWEPHIRLAATVGVLIGR